MRAARVVLLALSVLVANAAATVLYQQPCAGTLDIQSGEYSCADCYAFHPDTAFEFNSETSECLPILECLSVSPAEVRNLANFPAYFHVKTALSASPVSAVALYSAVFSAKSGFLPSALANSNETLTELALSGSITLESRVDFINRALCKTQSRAVGLTLLADNSVRLYKTAGSRSAVKAACYHSNNTVIDLDTLTPFDSKDLHPEVSEFLCQVARGLQSTNNGGQLVVAPCTTNSDANVLRVVEARISSALRDLNNTVSSLTHECPTHSHEPADSEASVFGKIRDFIVATEKGVFGETAASIVANAVHRDLSEYVSSGTVDTDTVVAETPVVVEQCVRKLVKRRRVYSDFEGATVDHLFEPKDLLLPISAHLNYSAQAKTVNWRAMIGLRINGKCGRTGALFVCANKDLELSLGTKPVKEVLMSRGQVSIVLPEQPVRAFQDDEAEPAGSLLWGLADDISGDSPQSQRAYIERTAVRCPNYNFAVREVSSNIRADSKCTGLETVIVQADLISYNSTSQKIGEYTSFQYDRSVRTQGSLGYVRDADAAIDWETVPTTELNSNDTMNVFELEAGVKIRAWDTRSPENTARVSLIRRPDGFRVLTDAASERSQQASCISAAITVYKFDLLSECGNIRLSSQEVLGNAVKNLYTGPKTAPVFTRTPVAATGILVLNCTFPESVSTLVQVESSLLECFNSTPTAVSDLVQAVSELPDGKVTPVAVRIASLSVRAVSQPEVLPSAGECNSGVTERYENLFEITASFSAVDQCGQVSTIDTWKSTALLFDTKTEAYLNRAVFMTRAERGAMAAQKRRLLRQRHPLLVDHVSLCASVPLGFSGVRINLTELDSELLSAFAKSTHAIIPMTPVDSEKPESGGVQLFGYEPGGKKKVQLSTYTVTDSCGKHHLFSREIVIDSAICSEPTFGIQSTGGVDAKLRLTPVDQETMRAINRAYILAQRVRRPLPALATMDVKLVKSEIESVASTLRNTEVARDQSILSTDQTVKVHSGSSALSAFVTIVCTAVIAVVALM